mmetsp:Transcript_18788/g.54298  ORF Transcript_18788/g.54298 Transcript_18788/m.54298 type:complete len:224 (+) Transcript_18788:3399-4070(+)
MAESDAPVDADADPFPSSFEIRKGLFEEEEVDVDSPPPSLSLRAVVASAEPYRSSTSPPPGNRAAVSFEGLPPTAPALPLFQSRATARSCLRKYDDTASERSASISPPLFLSSSLFLRSSSGSGGGGKTPLLLSPSPQGKSRTRGRLPVAPTADATTPVAGREEDAASDVVGRINLNSLPLTTGPPPSFYSSCLASKYAKTSCRRPERRTENRNGSPHRRHKP